MRWAATAVAFVVVLDHAEGGTYVLTPFSRPVLHSAVFKNDSFENFEDCPGCLNSGGPERVRERGIANTNGGLISQYGDGEWPLFTAYANGEVCDNGNFFERDEIADRHGICGDPKQFALEGTNAYSGAPGDWSVVRTYQQGSVMDVKVVITEHLWGHLEFFICDVKELRYGAASVPRQECFNQNPLTRAEGDSINSPIDPDFPGRYYIDPPCKGGEGIYEDLPEGAPRDAYVINMQYQLPSELFCDHCVLQMVHYTGATCKHIGYDEFAPDSWPSECAPSKADWIEVDLLMCGMEGFYPEEFWSCADIAIVVDGPTEQQTPAPAPAVAAAPGTRAPTARTTVAPYWERAEEPTASARGSDGSPAPTVAVGTDAGRAPTARTTVAPNWASIEEPAAASDGTEAPVLWETAASTAATSSPTWIEVSSAPTPPPTMAGTAPTLMPASSGGVDGDVDESDDDYTDGIECMDPVEDFSQCGGLGWVGSECCGEGLECVRWDGLYSQCLPITVAADSERCADEDEQCGGVFWTGTTCCVAGTTCNEITPLRSSCQA